MAEVRNPESFLLNLIFILGEGGEGRGGEKLTRSDINPYNLRGPVTDEGFPATFNHLPIHLYN